MWGCASVSGCEWVGGKKQSNEAGAWLGRGGDSTEQLSVIFSLSHPFSHLPCSQTILSHAKQELTICLHSRFSTVLSTLPCDSCSSLVYRVTRVDKKVLLCRRGRKIPGIREMTSAFLTFKEFLGRILLLVELEMVYHYHSKERPWLAFSLTDIKYSLQAEGEKAKNALGWHFMLE